MLSDNTLHIIHDYRRKDRAVLFRREIERQNILSYAIHNAVVGCDKKHICIAQSHKSVVQFAKDNQLERVIIAEDDFYFPAENGYKYFLNSIPQKYNLHLGGMYVGKYIVNQYMPHNPVQVLKWSGLHLYVVHHSFYDFFLQADTVAYNIELALSLIAQQNGVAVTCCYPYAAVQAETPSDNIAGRIYKIRDYFNECNTYGLKKIEKHGL